MDRFVPLNISEYFDNDGISYDRLKSDGSFDAFGATFPAEELPASNTAILIDDVPFFFPDKEDTKKNNMTIRAQSFAVPEERYESLYVLGAVEGKNGESYQEELLLSSRSGPVVRVALGLSNWLLFPVHGERRAFGCSHLHHPDAGQTVHRNFFSESPLQVYSPMPGNAGAFRSEAYGKNEFESAVAGEWRPKIWLQRIPLPSAEALTEFSFEAENLHMHIFAMTLERARAHH